jgi:hypothetical protein
MKQDNLGIITRIFVSIFFNSLQEVNFNLHTTQHWDIYYQEWRLFDKYLANIELIPYHSEGISLPSNFSSSQLAYLTERYKARLEFIKRYNPKLIIFNGRFGRIGDIFDPKRGPGGAIIVLAISFPSLNQI